MKIRSLALLALLGFATPAAAQGIPGSSTVVPACGTVSPSAPYTPGQVRSNTVDPNGKTCTDAVFTGIVSGTVTANSAVRVTTQSSGTIVTGGTFQTVANVNTSRLSLDVENLCNVTGQCATTFDFCYLTFGTSPTISGAIPLPPGAGYLRSSGVIPSDIVSITCDSTGDHYRATVQ